MKIVDGYGQYLRFGWKYFLPHNSIGLSSMVNFLNRENPDIVTFAEIDGRSWRTKEIDQVKFISKHTNLEYSLFFPTRAIGNWINQGNAILSKYPLTDSMKISLPGFGEKRYLCQASIKINEQNILCYVTHLSTNNYVNVAQRHFIARKLLTQNKSIILTGDFNSEKDSLNIIRDNTQISDVDLKPTFPTWRPTKILDHIFISQDCKVQKVTLYKNDKFSDHLPVGLECKIEK